MIKKKTKSLSVYMIFNSSPRTRFETDCSCQYPIKSLSIHDLRNRKNKNHCQFIWFLIHRQCTCLETTARVSTLATRKKASYQLTSPPFSLSFLFVPKKIRIEKRNSES